MAHKKAQHEAKERDKKKPHAKDDDEKVPVEKHSTKKVHGKEFTAKKDFAIHHNDYHREIKVGDDLSDVPGLYHANLRTEGVL